MSKRPTEFTIEIPRAIGGCQKWNYSANGRRIGQITKHNDPMCKHDYLVTALEGVKRHSRFSTFPEANAHMKGLA